MNFSIVAGTTGTFAAALTPTNGAQAPGTFPKWTASDPSIALTPSADGLTCEAAVPATDAAASFDLQVTAVSADATVGTVSKTHTIAVTKPTPPALQSIDFIQTAG